VNLTSKNRFGIFPVFLAGFFLAVHYATVAYVNSSLLENVVGKNWLNIVYIIGSIFSVFALYLAPKFFRRFGSKSTLLLFILLEIIAVFGLGSINLGLFIVLLFLLHHTFVPSLYFSLDVNLESHIDKEKTTGAKRGIFLTIQNIAWVVSPLALSFFIQGGNFDKIYFISGIALILLLITATNFFENTKKADRDESDVIQSIKSLFFENDLRSVIVSHFILNIFYSWMVIYLPLLLIKEIGFEWDKIGILFTIMLLPFLLFELPAGILADRKIGEKEILITGIIITSVATMFIPFIKSGTFLIWALILFGTRVGASLFEIASESYFFKHVKENDTGTISLFRTLRPISFVVTPIIALPIIYFFSYQASFYFLSIITLCGLFFIPKVDTK
jgi:MFS family permease